jgi:hypothetical protein
VSQREEEAAVEGYDDAEWKVAVRGISKGGTTDLASRSEEVRALGPARDRSRQKRRLQSFDRPCEAQSREWQTTGRGQWAKIPPETSETR